MRGNPAPTLGAIVNLPAVLYFNNNSLALLVGNWSAEADAVMVGRGMIREKGIVPPEDCIYGANYTHFIAELEKRNIRILETVEAIK